MVPRVQRAGQVLALQGAAWGCALFCEGGREPVRMLRIGSWSRTTERVKLVITRSYALFSFAYPPCPRAKIFRLIKSEMKISSS